MNATLEEFARRGRLVIFAGAGVSAGSPSSLPGWVTLNEQIMAALRLRLENDLERPGWLAAVASGVGGLRKEGGFPPDYQAQIIEEVCGERYFRALQALDVDVVNRGHDGIAALAAQGAVVGVVTTNFDRLIERALNDRGVAFEVAFDDAGYERLAERLHAGATGPLPLIKIHGCVSAHLSMIDTLKQRKLGRSRALQSCLDGLFSGYWLYLGFSAADLESDPKYLMLTDRAANSPGAMFVRYPRHPGLTRGAKMLKSAYGTRWSDDTLEIHELLGQICVILGIEQASRARNDVKSGAIQVEERLAKWASTLSLSATGLCLAAILEAAGEAEAAARVLDRLVRKEIYDERGSGDFRALQLHYGRLGAALGRFANVPDWNGAASNASVEAAQSLMRLKDTEYEFPATCWLGCLWLWLNRGEPATQTAIWILLGFREGNWRGLEPRTDEEAVDAWLAMALVLVVNTHSSSIKAVLDTFPSALEHSRRSGDVVRTARVIALHLLAYAETTHQLTEIAASFDAEFQDAVRVGDGFALGFRDLAFGRWHVGAGGLELARGHGNLQGIAASALTHLNQAATLLEKQAMDPWVIFTRIQIAKALLDLGQFDALQHCMDTLRQELQRFPILASHVYEAAGQIQRALGKPEAAEQFRSAVQCAEQSGLMLRKEMLTTHMAL